MNTPDFIDAVKKDLDLQSDRKFGEALDIPNGVVSRYRNGLRKLSPADCRKVAAALHVSVDYVMAEIQAEKAQRPEDRRVWKRLAKLAKNAQAAALGIIAAITLLLTTHDAQAAERIAIATGENAVTIYMLHA